MTKEKKHVLPNGYTFLAVSSGSYGYWEKATDPITAIRNCYSRTSRRNPEPIYVIYGKDSELIVNEMGGYGYDVKNLPVACGSHQRSFGYRLPSIIEPLLLPTTTNKVSN